MSTQDIFRKYLDILKEEESKQASASSNPEQQTTGDTPDPSQITYAPPKGKGSIKAVIQAVREFQEASKLPVTGVIDPKTLAEILTQSGTMGEEEMQKLQSGEAGSDEHKSEVVAETAMGSSKQDQLMEKAALHLGYAHGLMGHDHQCPHAVGTSAHSHYAHGHQLGLKECGGAWGAGSATSAM